MKAFVTTLLLVLAISSVASAQPNYRRGNPVGRTPPHHQFFVVDSDDNYSLAPVYGWIDTLVQYNEWFRVPFANPDNASTYLPGPKGIAMSWYQQPMTIRPFITTNGLISLDSMEAAPFANKAMPTNDTGKGNHHAYIAALWGDWEMRPGDTSRVLSRVVGNDSMIISYYNLGLKGTNGKVLATFQVIITNRDSSVTINYRNFTGSWAGVPAAQVIQGVVTIGVQDIFAAYGTNYLHKGTYSAVSQSSSIYAKDLHDGLAVKFIRRYHNAFRAYSITSPNPDRAELSSNVFVPGVRVENLTDTTLILAVRTVLSNVGSGSTLFARSDTITVLRFSTADIPSVSYTGISCGSYKLTATVTAPSIPAEADAWPGDNSISRLFTYMNTQTIPWYEEWSGGFNNCGWQNRGAKVVPATDFFYYPAASRAGQDGTLVLDRTAEDGFAYVTPGGGDTVISAPINLQGKTDVWLQFSYQRGSKMDDIRAGVMSRTLSGPDIQVTNSSGAVVRQGDTLLVEGLLSSGSIWNPSASSWTVLGRIQAGLDINTQKFRLQLPSSMLHNHFRVRLRVAAHNASPDIDLPHEDRDSWGIDAIQIASPNVGQTDIEVLGFDLGNGPLTHVPRDIKGLTPKVKLSNNGLVTQMGVYLVRAVLKDQLNREVYHRLQAFAFPSSRTDTVIEMPIWDIRGSQGGVFTAKITVDQLFAEYYNKNDTNTFFLPLFIDDVYAFDDGTPDSVGTKVLADKNFYLDFKPATTDSLRGIDVYMTAGGPQTSWQVQIKKGNTVIADRGFAITPTGEGWSRGFFTKPVLLEKDEEYRIQFNTAGSGMAGDASRGLILLRVADNVSPQYTVVDASVMRFFRDAGQTRYDSNATNRSQGGALVPMVRLVYTGSQQFLPVELISFGGARTSDGNIRLNWRTAKEEQVSHFTVERMHEDVWLSVANAGPRSEAGSEYGVMDNAAPAGSVTYRLIETDLDGTTHHLGTTTIGPLGDALPVLSLYPNPAREQLRVDLGGVTAGSVSIIDVTGKVVLAEQIHGKSAFELAVGQLAAGRYVIEIETANGKMREAVSIVR